MNSELRLAYDNVIIMKVGTHGPEGIDQIVARKLDEQGSSGCCFWGYGGSSCHPLRQVQAHATRSGGMVTCMFVGTTSNPRLGTTYAREFTADGILWQPIPAKNQVTSSRWALVISNLRRAEHSLDLAQYSVAVGPSEGKPVSQYLRGRSDKACARLSDSIPETSGSILAQVMLVADLVPPYGVVLR